MSDLLDKKIKIIEEDCYSDEPSTLFISNSELITSMWNKSCKYFGKEEIKFVPNFRYEISKTKPYKGTRKNPKPFHFNNIAAYMVANYDVVISRDGLEADDELAIAQKQAIKDGLETTICSRDKDLRICEGHHYSWECGKQPSLGPTKTDSLGWLETRPNGKIVGYGLTFFLFQMITGDTADNIPALKGKGEVFAWNYLEPNFGNKEKLIKSVKDLYKEMLGENSKEYFLEQANLLWIIQKRNKGFQIGELK